MKTDTLTNLTLKNWKIHPLKNSRKSGGGAGELN